MKKNKLLLPLMMISLGGFAQVNDYPTTGDPVIYNYSPLIYLQRNTSEGGYIQGIQTRLSNGTNNWFFGNQHDERWIVAKGDYTNPKLTVINNGNVGIGTNNPLQKFVVSNQDQDGLEVYLQQPLGIVGLQAYNRANSGYVGMQFDASKFIFTAGNVGIGTTNPTAPLHAFGGTAMTSGWNRTSVLEAVYPVQVFNSNSSKYAGLGYDHGNGLFFWVNATSDNVSGSGTMAMSIQNNGNVLIGAGLAQYNPAYKLNINGKARANEIVVNTTGADFVFENNYKLRPLAEVESFVKQNKHLPEIPTAKAMQAEGIGVSELQTKLLQKVEELTLYLIEQNKRIEGYQIQQEKQQKEIEQLKALLNKK